jgi:hypothetical protein
MGHSGLGGGSMSIPSGAGCSGGGFKVQEEGNLLLKALRERDAIAVECCVRQYYIAKVSQKQGI